MDSIVQSSAYFGFFITLFGYWVSTQIAKRMRSTLCNPLLLTIIFIIAFLKLADISYASYDNGAKYIYKGMLIAVEGRISQNSYEKDGTKYNSIEVIADKIEYLDKIKHEVNDIKEADLKTITQSDIQLDLTDNLPF